MTRVSELKITVNDEAQALPAESTVADLLTRLNVPPQRVAVEVNERLVRRGQYAETPLRDGDRVEIVTLVGGG